jgi:hypothetical protein
MKVGLPLVLACIDVICPPGERLWPKSRHAKDQI